MRTGGTAIKMQPEQEIRWLFLRIVDDLGFQNYLIMLHVIEMCPSSKQCHTIRPMQVFKSV